MPVNTASFTIADYGEEKGSLQINIGPLTAANFTAKRDAVDDLKAALPGLIRGEIRKTNINEVFAESTTVVTDKEAQRETKWLVTYRDETQFFDVGNTIANAGYGNLYSVEVPTADLSLLPTTGEEKDTLDLTGAAAAAFVTAFEAVQNSPTGGVDINVISIKHVGRST